LSSGETAPTLKSTDVPAVWRDGGRWKMLVVVVVMLVAAMLSGAVGEPDEADHPRMLRVRMGGG